MKTKTLWVIVSSLIVAMLLLASCGPKATTAPAPAPAPAPVPAPTAKPAPASTPPPVASPIPTAEKPKYGGTLNILDVAGSVIGIWDSAAGPTGMGHATYLVHEQFAGLDWSKGLAGSGEIDWGAGVARFDGYGYSVAESWETPEIGIWILHIRRGVHYALDPASEASRLVNGREFTADDAVYNIRRYTTDPAFPNAGVRRSQAAMAAAVTVEKTGPWDVTLKAPVDPWIGFWWIVYGGNSHHIFAPEVIKKYGSGLDWRNAVGMGPYVVTDVVTDSVATFKRNSNFWEKELVGPGKGDQLPYVDTVKVLIVPDTSTRMAAMRTGKGDWITNVESEDALSLIKTNPKLQYKRFLPSGYGIHFRIEKAELPFKDARVRQALMMATDFESMKNDLYKGDAEILIYPVPPNYTWLSVPMKELPESVQALYRYNPEGAKKLLADAGYPKGFKTKIIVENVSSRMDPAAVFKAMWAKVGVDVELQPRETAVYTAISTARSWDEMLMGTAGSTSLTLIFGFSGLRSAIFGWSDPAVEDTFREMQKYMIVDMAKVDELYRKAVPSMMQQAFIIPRPTPYSYTLWSPWVKNYHGERGETDFRLFVPHVWIDQDLKEQMSGTK